MAGKLGEMLLKAGLISPEQLDKALKEQETAGGRLGSNLVKLGFISEEEITKFLSQQYGVPAVNLSDYKIDAQILKLIPTQIAQKYGVIPISRLGRVLTVAMVNPSDILAIEDIKFSTGFEVHPVVASETAVWKTIDKHYGSAGMLEEVMHSIETEVPDSEIEVIKEEEEEETDKASELSAAIDSSPAAKLVQSLIFEATQRRASDIHIEPYEKDLRVRYQIDGVLHEIMSPPYRMKSAIVARVKILARLKIDEKRLPQDGRIKMKVKDRPIDIRVAILPTQFGEKIGMRILDRTAVSFDLTVLGFEEKSMRDFRKGIHTPYGIVLVTGPTGCGKTTTLYASITELNSLDVNIMTAEDPVEYSLIGINQVAVREEVGMTFAAALRAFLRQDPNIIMVGEIRDKETAEIAIRSALTGHLVLSTVHTNSAALTLTRLVDMGVEPFLMASSLLVVQSQRLVRRVCENCRQPVNINPKLLEEMKINPQEFAGVTVYQGKGCEACNNTGYKGRIALCEVMSITPAIRDLMLVRAPTAEIEAKAVEEGMLTLRRDGIVKIKKGVTTLEEVLKETVAE
ncbi:MAG: type IV-A pilus assembly ATPase PilB [Candidatus Edwardsbacteria bacterium]